MTPLAASRPLFLHHAPRHFELLAPCWSHLSHIVAVRGEGSYVYTNSTEGSGDSSPRSRYIDFTCGIGVTNTGHCHPRVVQAVKEQTEKIIFGQINCMLTQPALDLAGRLGNLVTSSLPSLDTFFFANSGAEAIEGVVKMARSYTKKPNVIVFEGGFHGRTALAMALTGSKTVYRAGFAPLPSGVFFAPFPDVKRYAREMRFDSSLSDQEVEDMVVGHCLKKLEFILKTQTSPSETAAICIEPVLGEGGYIPAPASFLRGLREICSRHGILFVVDEVQSGFGRTGDWWAHSAAGVEPDVMVMAKGIASGFPLSCIAAPRKFFESMPVGSHGGTYGGGNAVVLAAACATIDALSQENLLANPKNIGPILFDRLEKLKQRFPFLRDIRGRGYMIGVEFFDDQGRKSGADITKHVQHKCLESGLMLLSCGAEGNVIRWIPPLVADLPVIEEALQIFEHALQSAQNSMTHN